MQTTPFIAGKRALAVYPSDNTEIPFPQEVVSGESDVPSPYLLTDTYNTFAEVKAGDIVYNKTSSLAAKVISVLSPGVIRLNDDIFTQVYLESYTIYATSNETTNDGCALYVGGFEPEPVDIKVVTMGDDVITFSVQKGSLLPCLVKKVFETGTTPLLQLIALW